MRNDITGVSFVVDWNQICMESGIDLDKIFKVNIEFTKKKLHPLHLAALIPSLSMIVDLASSKNCKILAFDENLKLPSNYVKQGFLSSKKTLLRIENIELRKVFYSTNEGILLRRDSSSSSNSIHLRKVYTSRKMVIRNKPPTMPIRASTGGFPDPYNFQKSNRNEYQMTDLRDDLEENVKVNNVPISVTSMRRSCQMSQGNGSIFGDDNFPSQRESFKKELNAFPNILTRGTDMDVNRDKGHEQVVQGIKSRMIRIFSEFNNFFNDVYFSFNHKNLQDGERIKLPEQSISSIKLNFGNMWKKIKEIVLCLKILNGCIKTQLNFPKQSHTYKNLKKSVEYLVKMIKVMSSKLNLNENYYLLTKTVDCLKELINEIYKIPSLASKTNKFMVACAKYLFYENKSRRGDKKDRYLKEIPIGKKIIFISSGFCDILLQFKKTMEVPENRRMSEFFHLKNTYLPLSSNDELNQGYFSKNSLRADKKNEQNFENLRYSASSKIYKTFDIKASSSIPKFSPSFSIKPEGDTGDNVKGSEKYFRKAVK